MQWGWTKGATGKRKSSRSLWILGVTVKHKITTVYRTRTPSVQKFLTAMGFSVPVLCAVVMWLAFYFPVIKATGSLEDE